MPTFQRGTFGRSGYQSDPFDDSERFNAQNENNWASQFFQAGQNAAGRNATNRDDLAFRTWATQFGAGREDAALKAQMDFAREQLAAGERRRAEDRTWGREDFDWRTTKEQELRDKAEERQAIAEGWPSLAAKRARTAQRHGSVLELEDLQTNAELAKLKRATQALSVNPIVPMTGAGKDISEDPLNAGLDPAILGKQVKQADIDAILAQGADPVKFSRNVAGLQKVVGEAPGTAMVNRTDFLNTPDTGFFGRIGNAISAVATDKKTLIPGYGGLRALGTVSNRLFGESGDQLAAHQGHVDTAVKQITSQVQQTINQLRRRGVDPEQAKQMVRERLGGALSKLAEIDKSLPEEVQMALSSLGLY